MVLGELEMELRSGQRQEDRMVADFACFDRCTRSRGRASDSQ